MLLRFERAGFDSPAQKCQRVRVLNPSARLVSTLHVLHSERIRLLPNRRRARLLVADQDYLFSCAGEEDAMQNCHILPTVFRAGIHVVEIYAENTAATGSQFFRWGIRDYCFESSRKLWPGFCGPLELRPPLRCVEDLELHSSGNMHPVVPQRSQELRDAVGGEELEDRTGVKDVHQSVSPMRRAISSGVSASPDSGGLLAVVSTLLSGVMPSSANSRTASSGWRLPSGRATTAGATRFHR